MNENKTQFFKQKLKQLSVKLTVNIVKRASSYCRHFIIIFVLITYSNNLFNSIARTKHGQALHFELELS